MGGSSHISKFFSGILILTGICTIVCLVTFGYASPLPAAASEQDETQETATPSPTPSGTSHPTNTASLYPSPTSTNSSTITPIGAASPTATQLASLIPSATSSASPTPSATVTITPSPSSTPTPSQTITPSPQVANQPQISLFSASNYTELTIIISEIAWAGTSANSSDEWIELYNPGQVSIDLSGWRLVSSDGSPDIELKGSIAPGEFYLLERSDDNTVSNIAADITYAGALGNSGETILLVGPSGKTIDTANLSGSEWPAGDSSSRASMERVGIVADSSSSWETHNGSASNGQDANGDTIRGSPKAVNSIWQANHTATPTMTPSSTNSPTSTKTTLTTETPTPSPTTTPSPTSIQNQYVVINEISWSGTSASSSDEWIELYNYGSQPVDLSNWSISATDGTPSITLNGTISSGNFFLLERTDDNTISNITADQIYSGSLGNSGEILFLRDANGNVIDTVNFDGGAWPGGTIGSGSPEYATQERISLGESDTMWGTNNGITRNGEDANGNPINGTPKSANSTTIENASTNTATASPTPTATSSPTPTTSATSSSTPTSSPTNTATSTQTPTLTSSPSQTATASLTNTVTPTSTSTEFIFVAEEIVINEIGWSGTQASSFDEWIELYNTTAQTIDLTGCTLLADDGSPNINLTGTISANGFFILERTDDNTISNIAADQIYSGTLSNAGETLRLYSPSGELIDTANIAGGAWPAGDSDLRTSMERKDNTSDSASAWGTNNGVIKSGSDAQGNVILGSPGQLNSLRFSTATPSPTSSPSPTITPTSTGTIQLVPPQTIWISEIAWSGTIGHYNDEWIELFNPGYETIDLSGWLLIAADGSPEIQLAGEIPSWGYFLLERTDDNTVANIPADQLYSGSLSNSGETLYLFGPHGELVDTASQSDGNWPAGHAELHKTMERRGTSANGRATWNTNNGYVTNGIDVDGYHIQGTPKKANSNWFPTPTPTSIPEGARVLINEFLPHPKYDWNGDGKFTSDDEYMELINVGTTMINLEGWLLDDIEEGSTPYELPDINLAPGEALAFFRAETRISLSDNGDSVRLLSPNGEIIDERSYNFAKDVNLSWCRLPDEIEQLIYPCWPTPNKPNAVYKNTTMTQSERLIPVTGSQPEQPTYGILPGWLIPNGSRLYGYR